MELRPKLPENGGDVTFHRVYSEGDPLGIRTCTLRDGTTFVIVGTDDDPRSTIVLRRDAGKSEWKREDMGTVPAEVRR